MGVAARGKQVASWWQREASGRQDERFRAHSKLSLCCHLPPPASSRTKIPKCMILRLSGVVIVTNSEGAAFAMPLVMYTVQVWITEPPEIEEMKIR